MTKQDESPYKGAAAEGWDEREYKGEAETGGGEGRNLLQDGASCRANNTIR